MSPYERSVIDTRPPKTRVTDSPLNAAECETPEVRNDRFSLVPTWREIVCLILNVDVSESPRL